MGKIFISMILLFCLWNHVPAQKAVVHGFVADASDQKFLMGVNIMEKVNSGGTSTDENGYFYLELEPGPQILEFSYLGYETQRRAIDASAGEVIEIKILLSQKESLLTTVVVTASKYEKKIGEETVSLDVIRPAMIESQNLTTVDKAIEQDPGVTIIDRQVNIRGGAGYSYGAGSRVQVLLDGLPILQADAGLPNWSSIPLENVGQIEIIKGAASALYGSSAMNGIVNVRTAYPTGRPVTKISVWGGAYIIPKDQSGQKLDWWNRTMEELKDHNQHLEPEYLKRPYDAGISMAHRQKIGKLDLVIGGQTVSNQDQKYFSFERYGRFSTQIRYRQSENFHFGINSFIQGGESGSFFLWNGNEGIDKYLPARITGAPTKTKILRIAMDPFITYQNEEGNTHKFLSRWYKTDNHSNNDQGNFSNYFYGEYQYQKNWEANGLTLTSGMVGTHVNVKAPLYDTGDDRLFGRGFAVYIQAEKNVFEKLNLSAGARLENHWITGGDAETKPVIRAGMNYQAAEYTFLRASFGQGFRFPTIAEKFINTSLGKEMGIVPNSSLNSESGISAELGLKQGFRWGSLFAFADVAGFYNRYVNMMEFNPTNDPSVLGDFDFGFQSQNVGNTQILGAEISLQGEIQGSEKMHSSGWVGYTFLIPTYLDWEKVRGESSSTYNVLKYRFRHTFTGSWDFDFFGWSAGLSAKYFSFMENIDRTFISFIPGLLDYRNNRKKDPLHFDPEKKGQYRGDLLLDARAGYSFLAGNNQYKISMIVKNLMNREYSLRPGMMEAPFSYTLRLDFRF